MTERHRQSKQAEEAPEDPIVRVPEMEEEENYAATGLFQPSENPRPEAALSDGALEAARALTQLTHEVNAMKDTAQSREGKVEFPQVAGAHDLVVGPDIGGRPHRPALPLKNNKSA